MGDVRIAVLTFTDDLHALAIQAHLRTIPGTVCDVVEVDTIADRAPGVSWSTEAETFPATVPTRDGAGLDPATCDVIWFRRWNRPQVAARSLADPAAVDVVTASTSSAVLGTLRNTFRGRWVSDPEATRRAENKLVQLAAARAAGFRVPRTLVSNDPAEIRRFCGDLEGRAVLKAVRGTAHSQLFTLEVTPEHLADDDALRLCPTIFQERVPGSRHVRALCCGDEVYAATIECADLDWRKDLRVPMAPYAVDEPTRQRLARLLELLGLRMGVADIKIDEAGDLVWLELNPQGQFLFVEGLTGMDLTGAFSRFLRREAPAAATRWMPDA